MKCDCCDSKGYLEVTREDSCEYIEKCDACDDLVSDEIAMELARADGYKLNKEGKIL